MLRKLPCEIALRVSFVQIFIEDDMKRIQFLVLCGLIGVALPVYGGARASLKVPMVDKTGAIVGFATLSQIGINLHVSTVLRGISPGGYSLRFRQGAACQGPDFLGTGAEFDPLHGTIPGPKGQGFRDTAFAPSLVVAPDGTASGEFASHWLSLTGGINNVMGHTLVLQTDKIIACGIIPDLR